VTPKRNNPQGPGYVFKDKDLNRKFFLNGMGDLSTHPYRDTRDGRGGRVRTVPGDMMAYP
jgi:hypothetical protein